MKNNIDDLVNEVYFFDDYYSYEKYTNEQLQMIMENQREHINYLEMQLSEYKRFILLITVVGLIMLMIINFLG